MPYAIETRGLTRTFGSVEALHDLDLSVPEGAAVALLGRSGAGKTTAIKLLAGFLHASRGESRLLGVASKDLGPAEWRRIGYASENQELYDWMTGEELLAFVRPLYPAWDGELEQRLRRLLALRLDRRIRHCSRGERAKLALACALPFRPRLLLLDEPFAGLDPLVREELLAGLVEIMGEGEWSLLFATQEIEEVERLADHVAFLDQGRLRLFENVAALQSRLRRIHVVRPRPEAGPPPDALDVSWNDQALSFVHTQYSELAEAQLYRDHSRGAVTVSPLSLREIAVVLTRAYRDEEAARA
jgi:ABC-2 type transport system ATP-binding protein